MNKLLTTISIAIAGGTVSAAAATLGPDVRSKDNRVIYEVFVRNFSNSAKLSAVTDQLDRLKDLGVDVVWLMPIQKGGDKDRWGTYSSPYAIKDYKSIDPLYGTADDFKTLVETAHSKGMEVWLDWVANHTSTDNVWTVSNPEYYGASFTHPMGWNDVYQLDYTNQEMRAAMIDAMKYWVTEFDIDGFRCDYADGVPLNFWSRAREELDAVKPLSWLAESAGEGSNVQLVKRVFDYNYAWKFNDALIEAGTEAAIADDVSDATYLLFNAKDAAQYEGKSRMVYLSNHDVVQDKKGSPDRHFGDNLKAMTVLEFTAYGMPLIYNGQEIKWSTGQVLLAERSVINWNRADSEITDLITALCALKHRCSVLGTGESAGSFIRHTPSVDADKVLVYERRNGANSLVVMLNFSDTEETFALSTLPGGNYTEYFTGDIADFSATHRFSIPAKGYAVWTRNDDSAIEPLNYRIYAEDSTGWDKVNLYGWGADNSKELFGAWPGASVSGVETLSDGVEYKVWEVPQTAWGHPYNLIFNCSSSQLTDYLCPLAGDVMVKLTAGGVEEKELLPELQQPDYAEETPWTWHESGMDLPESAPAYMGPDEYFSLQGVRVMNPGPGLYIVRGSGRVGKVLLR